MIIIDWLQAERMKWAREPENKGAPLTQAVLLDRDAVKSSPTRTLALSLALTPQCRL